MRRNRDEPATLGAELTAPSFEGANVKTLTAALGLLLTNSACALGGGAIAEPVNTRAAERPVKVNVTNHGNGPMEIYAVASGTSYRMGTVFPGFDGHFVLRKAMIGNGPVEFLARPNDGTPPVRSDRLLLTPGDVVDFEIAVHSANSTVTVRPRPR
jgi:hypothetical protein